MPDHANILFICTANYYRSRFAEEYFNFRAKQTGVLAKADSAGFEMQRWRSYNPGELSVHSIRQLESLGIEVLKPYREPKQFGPEMLRIFDRCIALSDVEHMPMAERLFPEVVDHLEFWEVEDVEFESPESALSKIQVNVDSLIASFR